MIVFRRVLLLLACGVASTVSACAFAGVACPKVGAARQVHASGIYDDSVVAFEQSSDPENPIDVNLYRGKAGSCRRVKVDAYSFEGASPEVESAFVYPLRGQPRLFVIVGWAIHHRGEGVYGRLYQVYAYGPDGKGGLVSDKRIADSDAMTGIEGETGGEPSHFRGKIPEGLKALVDLMGRSR